MKDITKQLPLNGTLKKHRRNTEKREHDLAKGIHQLFADELQDIYRSEKALSKAIPKMIKNATAVLLVETLTGYLELTKNNIARLEGAFTFIGEKTEGKKSKTMSYIVKDVRSIMKETDEGMVRDTAIISAVQKIEHYEIASYTTLCSLAETLGETGPAGILREIFDRVKAANERLSEITEFSIHHDAVVIGPSISGQEQLA